MSQCQYKKIDLCYYILTFALCRPGNLVPQMRRLKIEGEIVKIQFGESGIRENFKELVGW